MNLRQLDNNIPKHWVLLLRYYLPFFKKPAPFYFECRQFINHLKKISKNQPFPLNKLPDLLFILDHYSQNDPHLIALAKNIIATITPEQYQQIDYCLLKEIILQFERENKASTVLNELFQKIPAKVYKDIISWLHVSKNKPLYLIKWCARLADKFTLEDKLSLILSLPEAFVFSQRKLLYSLAFSELETYTRPDFAKILTAPFHEKFLKFILTGQAYLNFSRPFLWMLFSRWLEAENPLFLAYVKGLDINARFDFFKNLLQYPDHLAQNPQKFLRLCPRVQQALFIDQLIEYLFRSFAPEAKETLILTKKPLDKSDLRVALLNELLENTAHYRVNAFQFLALTSLAEKPLDLEKLKKNSVEDRPLSEYAQNFSLELQEYIAENSIKAIKFFIKDHIMPEVPVKNERYSLRFRFNIFFDDHYPNANQNPVEALKIIIGKIPENIQLKFEPTFQLLLPLLERLYQFLENPAIQRSKQRRLIAAEKIRKNEEHLSEARIELFKRIAYGLQVRVAIQHMEELYGKDAEMIQEKWKKTLGIHFFDANNEIEKERAHQEAKELINLKRERSVHYHCK